MSLFKLSNQIFTLGLSNAALSVYSYLCSIKGKDMPNGKTHIKVKQKTIAAACGIASIQTVAKALRELTEQQLIDQSIRTVRSDRKLSTNIYVIKKLPTTDGFFFVSPDMAFSGQLVPRQLVVYLFLCKAHSKRFGCSWNSYNDMAAQIHMKRETVIATIQELCAMQLICKQRQRSQTNSRVFVDNRYFIVQRETGTIKKKKPVSQTDFSSWLTECSSAYVNTYPFTVYHEWSILSSLIYARGSPQNVIRILNPNIYSSRKRKNKVIITVFCKNIQYAELKFYRKILPVRQAYLWSIRQNGAVKGKRRGGIFSFLVAKTEVTHEDSRTSSAWRMNCGTSHANHTAR